jgi:hypothetical protein
MDSGTAFRSVAECAKIGSNRAEWDTGGATAAGHSVMAKLSSTPLAEQVAGKLGRFQATHERILVDFSRSLHNSRHFIALAERALADEPEETVTMLEQIREIDLLRHLSEQYDEFQELARVLPATASPGVEATGIPGDGAPGVTLLRTRYEELMREAERQVHEIERLLSAIQTPQ